MHAEVVDADTGRPIANARLTITIARPLPGGRGSLIEEVWQHRGGPVDSTDAQGRAAVAMPPGKRAAVGMSAGQFPFKLEVAGYGPFTSSESLEMPAGKEVKLRVELQKSQ